MPITDTATLKNMGILNEMLEDIKTNGHCKGILQSRDGSQRCILGMLAKATNGNALNVDLITKNVIWGKLNENVPIFALLRNEDAVAFNNMESTQDKDLIDLIKRTKASIRGDKDS